MRSSLVLLQNDICREAFAETSLQSRFGV